MDKMTQSKSDIVAELLVAAASQRLRERAEEGCCDALARCAIEDADVGEVPLAGFDRVEILVEFGRHALVFKHGTLSYPFVETRIGLFVAAKAPGFYFRDLVPIGCYRLITHLDGEVDDDYLEFTETKAHLVEIAAI